KIIRRNDPIVGRWRVLGFRRRLVGPGEVNERNALRREWEDRHQSGVLDSRQRGETRLKLFVKLNDRRTIGVSHCGSENRKVKTFVGSNPGCSLLNRKKLRNNSPAFASSTSASAI